METKVLLSALSDSQNLGGELAVTREVGVVGGDH